MTGKCQSTSCSTKAKDDFVADVTVSPQVDILETDSEALLYMDLPGVSADGLSIRFEDGELFVEGSIRAPDAAEYVRQEFVRGNFRRSFTVGEAINAEGIDAELKNGILTLRLPKKDAAKARRIEVRTA